ncbi:MAG: FAD-dependent oxidoreductase [Chloroflexi bacterium]|nr:FAD-dependent oxidoreductase [Chloroflexota bacterium]
MKQEDKEKTGISRRDFLKTAAAVSAAGVIGAYVPKDVSSEAIVNGQKESAASENQSPEIRENDESWRWDRKNVKIEKLLEPGKIGKVQTRNRMIKTAAYGWILWDMATNSFRPEGLAYYEAIAKGGVGLMVMEDPAFRPDTIGRPFYDDASIAVESQLVDLIHKHNCPTFAQLTDFRPLMGIAASSAYYYPTKLDMNGAMPVALTVADIKDNTELIAKGAERCMKAGYDGVELNCACSHMFATFTSRFWNKREDEYGPQSFENRARIVTDMIQAIKQRCGSDFPVGILLNGFEMDTVELGNNSLTCTIEEGVELAKLYEQAGADSIQVRSHSIGNHITGFFPDYYYMFGEQPDTGYGQPIDIEKYWPEFITKYDGAGGFIDTAAKYKEALSIPIITVGSMDPRLIPDVVETALQDGKIDFVAMTRPLTADPELPNKIAAGQIDDVRPCAQCITCFPMTRCRVNAASTRANGPDMPEGYDVQPATTKKKVLVVGGGPAGLEAARVAALRGHEVTLYEKTRRLGGLMPIAAVVKGKHEKIVEFVSYLSNQVEKLGVNVKLGKEVDAAVVEELQPDAVIVATGGVETMPDIPGIDNSIVVSSESLHKLLELGLKVVSPNTLRTLSNFYMPVGKKVVIIGGQIQGVQLAEFLSQHDRDVTIVDEGPVENIGLNLPSYVKERVVLYNQSHGVKTLMGVKYHEINDEGIKITTSYGITETIKADSIIVALPTAPNTGLADSIKGKVAEVYTIGDCKVSGVMVDAVEAGNLTARKI